MSKQEKLLTVSTFINAMKVEWDVDSCLSIHATDLEPIHSKRSGFEIARGLSWPNQIGKNKKYDLIFGDFPFGMNSEEYQWGEIKLKIKRNWAHILTSLDLLGLNGISIFVIEPIAFGLNAIILQFMIDESIALDGIEDRLRVIPTVSSIDIIDFRRAFG